MPVKEHTNRLINEKSPYLLQHAHNPVDWYPWGDEAFEKAKAEDKPVFLSIGYSTCHWCHVMERESFEDEKVAELLNKDFVSVKVDREERPDVDSFYMHACTALNGSGGWPLNCFLAHDKTPFFAGTYFPKEDTFSMPGFISILEQIAELWKNRRSELLEASGSVLAYIGRSEEASPLRKDLAKTAFQSLAESFDPRYGGFGPAPKFPSLQNLLFLMRYAYVTGNRDALNMVSKTLRGMQAGGLYDHIGGGFFRYSTDAAFLVPHFEKMLYDNAMHILAYAEAGLLIAPFFADISFKVADFCLRELRDPGGGFYTAIDADSEGVEGGFYLFAPDEVIKALGPEDGRRWCRLFGITGEGNYHGKSIPNLIGRRLSPEDSAFARAAGQKLLAYRSTRVRPFMDDKILSGVNGLMTAALAAQGRMLGRHDSVKTASECADFILGNMMPGGRLAGVWRGGEARHPATSDDYAYLIWGLIELYEATFDPKWLSHALKLTQDMIDLFWDGSGGGFYLSGSDAADLPLRQKISYDGAIPSGNSVAAENLLRLSRICGRSDFERMSDGILNFAASNANENPSAYCGLLCALLHKEDGGTEIVLVNGEHLEMLIRSLPAFAPFTVAAVTGQGYEVMRTLAPFLESYRTADGDGRALAFVCRKGACKSPVSDAQELRKMLDAGRIAR